MNADKASSAESVAQRIDVHHHLASPPWLQAMKLGPIRADSPVKRSRPSSIASTTTPHKSRWVEHWPRSPSWFRASQIVYGSDFPYRTAAEHSKGVDAIFDEADRKRVNHENALRILPRLGSA